MDSTIPTCILDAPNIDIASSKEATPPSTEITSGPVAAAAMNGGVHEQSSLPPANVRPAIRRLLCVTCGVNRQAICCPPFGERLCKQCFIEKFESNVYDCVKSSQMFQAGDAVAVGVSGGKDSSVLAYVLATLNRKHNLGLQLFLLAIDEGIQGYRDDSLDIVKKNEKELQLPLTICSYKELYGWTMDEIVKKTGRRSNCTFCGVLRRQALERGAALVGANKLCTGHNADDCAETVLMNILRGDTNRLDRSSDAFGAKSSPLPRCKPLMYTYEKEIVMYAHFQNLEYFSTECIYSPNAYRGNVRELVKQLERTNPIYIRNIIHSAQHFKLKSKVRSKQPAVLSCSLCGFMSSNDVCKACLLIKGLNEGNADAATRRTKASRAKQPNRTVQYESFIQNQQ